MAKGCSQLPSHAVFCLFFFGSTINECVIVQGGLGESCYSCPAVSYNTAQVPSIRMR